MFKKQKIIFYILLLSILHYNLINTASADDILTEKQANIYIAPVFYSFFDPNYFIIDIKANFENQEINAVEFILNFDQKMLIAENIDYAESFCKLSAIEEINDNKIKITCGSTIKTSTNNTQISRIKFKKQKAGWTQLKFENSFFTTADSYGTLINPNIENHKIFLF